MARLRSYEKGPQKRKMKMDDLKNLEQKIDESFEKLNSSIGAAFERLGGTISKLLEKAKQAVSIEPETEQPESGEVATEPAASESAEEVAENVAAVKPEEKKRRGWKGGVNRSDLIREYFREHGMDVKNKNLIEDLEKSHKVKIEPSLVSTIRKKIEMEKGGKAARKPKAAKAVSKPKVVSKGKKEQLRGLPMPALCTVILSEAKGGLKIKDISKKAIEYGYEYRGKKGRAGLTQNVYQALHNLAQKKNHPGYNGKIAVVIHDEPSQRWKLNPKAVRAKKSA